MASKAARTAATTAISTSEILFARAIYRPSYEAESYCTLVSVGSGAYSSKSEVIWTLLPPVEGSSVLSWQRDTIRADAGIDLHGRLFEVIFLQGSNVSGRQYR